MYKSTSQEATVIPETERPTNKQNTEKTTPSEAPQNTENTPVPVPRWERKRLKPTSSLSLSRQNLITVRRSIWVEGDTGTCRPHRAKIGRQRQQSLKFHRKSCAQPFRGIPRGYRKVEKIISMRKKGRGFCTKKVVPFLWNPRPFPKRNKTILLSPMPERWEYHERS